MISPLHPPSPINRSVRKGEGGDVVKVILRNLDRYIPNENLSMDWYTTLAILLSLIHI